MWQAAHDRIAAARTTCFQTTGGQAGGRPISGIESKYLLTGFLECEACGGNLIVRNRGLKTGRRLTYNCGTHFLRGQAACANNVVVRMDDTDETVLAALEHDILLPEVVDQAIGRAVARLQPGMEEFDTKRETLEKQLADLEAQLVNLTTAVADGGDIRSLRSAITQREEKRERVALELSALGSTKPAPTF